MHRLICLVVRKKYGVLPVSLAIAALLDGASAQNVIALDSGQVTNSAKEVTGDESAVHARRLWARSMDEFLTRRPDGHRSHYSHRSSRGPSHGNSWHGNSHSNSHRSHYSSRTRPSSGSVLSNTAKRVIWRVIWNDDDDNEGDGYIPSIDGSSTTSTTTPPQQSVEHQVNIAFRFETCWHDDGDAGAPIELQLRGKGGKWLTVQGPTARTRLKRFENVEGTKCTIERPLSAITTWSPQEPGSYFLRHYYTGFKGISGFAHEEVINLIVS